MNGPYHAIMSALTPTGGVGGSYDIFNFGFGGSKTDSDQVGPWSPDSNPTPQSLLSANLLPQPELLQQQQQQQQQQFFYSPTPPGQLQTTLTNG